MALSRTQAAERLGIGIRRLRDLELQGKIKPKGRKGQRRHFTEEQIAAYARARRATAPIVAKGNGNAIAHGATAGEVFRMLRDGTEKIEIVIVLGVHPDLVEDMSARFEKMKREKGDLPAPLCANCKQRSARFCGGCLDEEPKR